jgi:hypothetical protein
MKKSFVLLTFLVVMFGLYGLKEVNASCSHALISIPDTIGKTSSLNCLVELAFKKCDSGEINITLEGENTPITVKRHSVFVGGGPAAIVQLRKEGGWGDRNVLKVPLDALCLDGAFNIPQGTKYLSVQLSGTTIYTVNKEKPPKIICTKRDELAVSSEYYQGKYTGEISFYVDPICPECVYRLYVYEGDKESYNRKTKVFYTMVKKDDSGAGIIKIRINPYCCGLDCNLYYEISNEALCNGLWFAIQVEDSYGNLSKISEEYRFMPLMDHIEKYCMLDGGTLPDDIDDNHKCDLDAMNIESSDTKEISDNIRTTDIGSNVNINSSNSDSGGCSILTLE